MNLLLIEDERKTADALKKGLQESGHNVDLVYNGTSGLAMAFEHKYDLIISDIIMPKVSGISLCQQIRARNTEVPILLLTALDSKDDIITGFEAGADDYLTKPFDFRELLLRVKSLTKRHNKKPGVPQALTFADITVNLAEKSVTRNGTGISLTSKEFKLLEYFMSKPNTVISRDELARDVWGIDFNTGTNIVEVYVNYLRNKLDKPFKKKVIHNIHGLGYILKEN